MQAVILVVLGLIIAFLVAATFFILDQRKQFNQRLNQFAGQLDGVLRDASNEARLTARQVMADRTAELNAQEKRILSESQENMVKLTNLTVRARVMLRDFVADLRDSQGKALDGPEDTLEGPGA